MDIESTYLYDEGSDEWIEIVIHKESPSSDVSNVNNVSDVSDAEKEKQWAAINARELKSIQQKNPFGCENCVWGIQSMEDTYPIYCTCLYGQRHTRRQQPFLSSLGEKIIEFFKYLWPAKN